jgi:DNA-nicking Smr family endonuclease
MNKYERTPEQVIDLHGYTTSEAEDVLRGLLKELKYSHVRIIVGKGSHGANGPVLRDFVKKYLTARHVHFNQSKTKDGGEGALEVFLK